MKKILIAFSTKHNATAEMAKAMAETLREMGEFEVDVKDAAIVLGLKPYDAVIVGSAIYTGHWQNEAIGFLRRYKDQLSRKPVWVFASGPLGEGSSLFPKNATAVPDDIREYIDQIQPRGVALFSGKLDPADLNFAERAISKLVRVEMGDFRDWDAIQSWALQIGEYLQASEIEETGELVKQHTR
ncbi:MAG: flavodoxin domain-containing protein [Anaerolineae bacterium]|nr:flavodoxin domain-containing protein [Anaerolineae bacterium]